MRQKIAEESVLFISIIKWVALATAVGSIVGLATTGFLKLLAWATSMTGSRSWTLFLLPAALFLSALMVKYLAPEAEGHGTEKVIEALHRRFGKIKAAVVPVKLVATVMTLALGGSAGKEGPCAQIGAGLSSLFADVLRFNNEDRKKLVICGISAGFAAVFGTPIAGSIFGVEVLFVGSILYEVLLPSFIAGITSFQIAKALGVKYFTHNLDFVPIFSEMFFLKVVLAGVFFGLVSVLLIETLKLGEAASKRIKLWNPLKGLIGGGILLVLAFTLSRQYLGLGLETIESCLRGSPAPWYAFIAKPVYTSLTLNFGGSGGIVTPIFFVGATSGAFFASLFHLHVATFSAIGLTSLLAGAANTPIAASILAVELFGPAVAPYATVACVISFLMTGHRSVYPSQILSIRKSSSLNVPVGQEMENLHATYLDRERGISSRFLKLLNSFKRNPQKP
ncbi:MAG: chloride channel protein [Acidobacteria bacterium]|nr:chloride channel protein [Acidobacteriota bacterium]